MQMMQQVVKSKVHFAALLLSILIGAVHAKSNQIPLIILPVSVHNADDSTVTAIGQSFQQMLTAYFETATGYEIFIPDSTTAVQVEPDNQIPVARKFPTSNKETKFQAVIQPEIVKVDDRLSILTRAYETPSNILIHSNITELSLADSTMSDLNNALTPICVDLDTIMIKKRTDWGYPFAQRECGVVFVESHSSISDTTLEKPLAIEDLFTHLQAEQSRMNLSPVRFKVLHVPSESDSTDSHSWGDFKNIQDILMGVIILWTDFDSLKENLNLVINTQSKTERLKVATQPPFFPADSALAYASLPLNTSSDKQAVSDLCLATILWRLGEMGDAEFFITRLNDPVNTEIYNLPITKFISAQYYHSKARMNNHSEELFQEALVNADREYSACLSELPNDSCLDAAYLHFNWADVRLQQEAWEDAAAGFEKAHVIFAKNNLKREAALMYLRMADVYTSQKSWDQVQGVCEQSVPELTAVGDSLAVSAALEKLGLIYELQNKPEKALMIYKRNADLNREIARPYETLRSLGRMGLLLRDQHEVERSLKFFEQEMQLANQLQSEPAIAKSHFHLGTLYHSMDSSAAAIAHFEKAYETMNILADTLGMARAMNNIGAVHHKDGDVEQARKSYQTALELSEKFGDIENQIRSHSNLGDLLADEKRWADAYKHYDRAIQMAEDEDNTRTAAIVSYSKGLAYVKNGLLQSGYKELQKAIELGGGTVSGNPEQEQAFLERLKLLIDDISEIGK